MTLRLLACGVSRAIQPHRGPTCSQRPQRPQRPWWNMAGTSPFGNSDPGPLGHCFLFVSRLIPVNFQVHLFKILKSFKSSKVLSKVLSILFGQPLADWYPYLVPLVINWKNDTYTCTQGNLRPSSAELPPKLMELELPRCEKTRAKKP